MISCIGRDGGKGKQPRIEIVDEDDEDVPNVELEEIGGLDDDGHVGGFGSISPVEIVDEEDDEDIEYDDNHELF